MEIRREIRITGELTQLEKGTYVKPTKITVGEYFQQWVNDFVLTQVRPKTAEDYISKINRHIIPSLGKISLMELKPSHIQAFYRQKIEAGRIDGTGGLSAMTVLHIHRILSQALEHGVRWSLIGANPAKLVDPPRPKRKEISTFDSPDLHRLLNALEGSIYQPIIYTAIHTGMRRSEILGLRWRDVNLDLATISVVQTLMQLKGGITHIQEPKTEKGRRQISLSASVVLGFRKHKENQQVKYMLAGNSLTPDSLLFSHPDGTPILPNAVSHAFIKTTRKLGIKQVRFHDLRHTHATLLLKQRIHPKVGQERLGHANISVTLDTYSHVTPDMQHSAALAFEQVMVETQPFKEA